MNVAVKITGLREVQNALAAVGQARRYVGEVYIEGERNRKLATIHEGGAILREGAASSLHLTAGGRIARRGGRASLERIGRSGSATRLVTRGGRIVRIGGQVVTEGAQQGYIPARNWLFVQIGDVQRIRDRIGKGVLAIARGKPPESFASVMQWCTAAAVASMRRNVTGRAGGRGIGEHIGLAEAPGVRFGHGSKMVPLKPVTRLAKLKKHGASPILVATGEMVDSVKGRVVEGAVR